MCTMISKKVEIAGSGKGTRGWFGLDQVNVSFDHPTHASYDHALNMDFVNQSDPLGPRVAVEISAESARKLVDAINTALETGEIYITRK